MNAPYKSPDRLFVQNMTDELIHFEVNLTTGETETITVPKTGIPIDLSLFASKEEIEKSRHFKKGISPQYKFLQVVPNDVADKIMEQSWAKKELARLYPVGDTTLVKQQIEEPEVVMDSESTPDEINLSTIARLNSDDEMVGRFMQLNMLGKGTRALALKVAELGAERNYPNLVDAAETWLTDSAAAK